MLQITYPISHVSHLATTATLIFISRLHRLTHSNSFLSPPTKYSVLLATVFSMLKMSLSSCYMSSITTAKPTLLLFDSNLKWNPLKPFKPAYKFQPATRFKPARLALSDNDKVSKKQAQQNPLDALAKSIVKTLKALQKPAVAAVIVGLLLAYDPSSALAASAGRVGGRSFSSSSSSSSSRSYSVPGGSGFTSSVPYYAPSPYLGGGGVYVAPAVGFGSSFFLIFVAFAAFMLVSGFLTDRSEDGGVFSSTGVTTVIKLQVGLLGLGRSLQKDLDRIAETADTSTPQGLSYVLTETTLALLRHPDFCISAYSSTDVKKSIDAGENRFNQLSIEERGKFDEETLVNVNSIKKRSSTSQRASGFRNEYIVVTILVAAEGEHKLPTINSSLDLKEALQKLGSIPSSKTLAVEVLWTPQNEDDSLSERELLKDYPLLRPL